MRVLVLGDTGMLGGCVYERLQRNKNLEITTLTGYNIEDIDPVVLENNIRQQDVVINCIGLVKPRLKGVSTDSAYYINTILPFILESICTLFGTKLICFSSDCVFTGEKGGYVESDPADAVDLYAMTKKFHPVNACTIRCSFIGTHNTKKYGFVEWLRSSKQAKVSGYTNCYWNGITCPVLADYINNIITKNKLWSGLRHVFSEDIVTKYQMCQMVNETFKLNLKVEEHEAESIEGTKINGVLDRTLSTLYSIDEQRVAISIREQIRRLYE